jgi:hypothetical protein
MIHGQDDEAAQQWDDFRLRNTSEMQKENVQ